MSTSSITSPLTTLTGSSTFASDLQNAMNRAISIASLPIQLVQDDQNQANSQAAELGQLATLFSGVQSSIQALTSGTGSGAQSASVSDSSVIKANLTSTALPGTYTIGVLDPGSSASAMSVALQPPVTDPSGQSISQSNSFTLTVDGKTYTIQPPAQNLNSLAAAINASGAPVQAVIVNIGSPTAPDYRLVIQSTTLGDIAIQLTDGNNKALLNPLNTGSSASYTVNGQPPAGISTNSSTVTVAPGLDVTLEGKGTATVTVGSSLSGVSNALSSFVNAYNSLVGELQKNRGQSGGALTGDNVVLSLQQALNQVVNYTGTGGSITSLTQLGVTFTQQGTLSFDPTALSGFSSNQITDALSFLGSPTSSGFLQFATNTLTGITDPSTGLINSELQTLQTHIQRDQDQINTDQARVSHLQASLQAQMAQADALIASIQQQNTFLQGLFQYSTSNNPNAGSAG
ncbi:MAG TPA: flagellar filament capping protein FliD [Bryobacteraceae bacterium]|nr:flagellar filament capping protein FliD [Bryobacteraceae bacterium]